MGALQGKVAVVMGASGAGSMGPAIARRLRRDGATVVISARREAELQALGAEIGVAAIACAITDSAALAALVAEVTRRHGGIDIAVNAAAQGHLAPLVDTDEAAIAQMLAINYTGPYLFLQAMIRAMRPRGGGTIVMISTASVRAIFENHSAYAGAKAGMEHLAQAAALEHGRDGIRINVIAPGLTATEMSQGFVAMPGVRELFAAEVPLGRLGTVDDVAGATAWLCSDDCFATGQIFEINGGLTLRRNPTAAEIQAVVAAAAAGPAAG